MPVLDKGRVADGQGNPVHPGSGGMGQSGLENLDGNGHDFVTDVISVEDADVKFSHVDPPFLYISFQLIRLLRGATGEYLQLAAGISLSAGNRIRGLILKLLCSLFL